MFTLDDISEVLNFLQKEKTLRHRNKILCIADKHGRDNIKEYTYSDMADNS